MPFIRPILAVLAFTAILPLALARDPAVPATTPAPKADNDLTPTLISLNHTDADYKTVLADLAPQVNRELYLSSMVKEYFKPQPVTIRAKNQPYWEVVTVVEDRMRGVVTTPPDGRMAISTGEPTLPEYRAISGPFLVIAQEVSHATRTRNPPPFQDDCHVTLAVRTEPHLRLLTLDRVDKPGEAVDEAGRSLVPALKYKPDPQPLDIDTSRNAVKVQLAPPADAGRKIARLKGKLHCTVATESKTIEIQDLAKSKPVKLDLRGAAIEFRATAANVTLNARQGKGQGWDDWSDVTELIACLRILAYDDQDRCIVFDRGSSSSGGASLYISYNPHLYWSNTSGMVKDKYGPPVRFVISVPVDFREVEIPYEFHDLPLP